MSNLISADFYRVRRGAALRNTCLAVLGILLLIMTLMLVSQSGSPVVAPEGMSAAEAAELEQDMAGVQQETAHVTNGAIFGLEMNAQFFIAFFFLPICIAVFCADFTAGTYRNVLSYESNRTKVYLAKLALSVVLCLAMVLGMIVISWLIGSIAFGFSGFTAGYFGQLFTGLLLQLPIYLGFVAVCHCLVAVTKKSSATIAIFLVGYIGLAVGLQLLATSVPGLEWLLLLEPQSGGRMMAMYEMASTADILVVTGYHALIAVAATVVGITAYRKSDMP